MPRRTAASAAVIGGPRARWHAAIVRLLLLGMLCAPAGCDLVLCHDGEITGTPAGSIVRPGDVFDLHASIPLIDVDFGPNDCGGHWYVNHIEGGSPEVGTIDSCGHYVAPASFVAGFENIFIEMTDWDMVHGGCADCCPSAYVHLEPVP